LYSDASLSAVKNICNFKVSADPVGACPARQRGYNLIFVLNNVSQPVENVPLNAG